MSYSKRMRDNDEELREQALEKCIAFDERRYCPDHEEIHLTGRESIDTVIASVQEEAANGTLALADGHSVEDLIAAIRAVPDDYPAESTCPRCANR